METKIKNNHLKEKIIILSLTALVIGILVFFLKDIFIPFVKLQINKDVEGASNLIIEKGILGWITVAIIEALQMVVIFIPAEFIQLTSGMAYPWYMALLLCDVGVILGSSIIYFIVRVLKFDGDIFNKGDKIEKYAKKSKSGNIIILMLLLFIMPIIPFGAICYFGSNKKVPYYKYVLTCAFGVIPSIGTSIIMGTAVKGFMANEIPLWILILAIIGAAAILFSLLVFVLHHFFFKSNDKTPDSMTYSLISKFFSFLFKHKIKIEVQNQEKLDNIGNSFLVLANHHSFFDFYAINKIKPDINYCYVVNRFYFTRPIIGRLFRHIGAIPKKIFDADMQTIKQILKTKDKYPIIIFPAARLSSDGTGAYINVATAKLAKKLDIPLVLVSMHNSYFARPKWRKKIFKSNIILDVAKVYDKESLKQISVDDLHKQINDTLRVNEFDNSPNIYNQKNKALGLDGLLYMCPFCKTMYSNVAKNNTITCSHCNRSFNILPNYHFDDKNVENIHEYYELIKQYENDNLDNLNLEIKVNTKIFNDKGKARKDSGIFRFDKEKVSYKSNLNDTYFEYKIQELEGIAYSINEEFEMYYKNELYYFYPEGDKKICTRIALIFELLKEKEINQN